MLSRVTDALLAVQHRRHGIVAVNRAIYRPGNPARLLTKYGADIGEGPIVHGPLGIHNAETDYANLRIGRRVHIGHGCLFDLANTLTVEDEATVSMGCTLLTHQDVGDRPLSILYPRVTLPTTIGTGAYLGANVTVIAGIQIGAGSVVGAGAVVTKHVPAGVLVAGVPARIVKTLAGGGVWTREHELRQG